MVLCPNKLPESERVCSGICKKSILIYLGGIITGIILTLHFFLCSIRKYKRNAI